MLNTHSLSTIQIISIITSSPHTILTSLFLPVVDTLYLVGVSAGCLGTRQVGARMELVWLGEMRGGRGALTGFSESSKKRSKLKIVMLRGEKNQPFPVTIQT